MPTSLTLPSNPATPTAPTGPPPLAAIEKAFHSVYPNDDYEYQFVDETIARFYTAEKNISRLLAWATGLTIFISCLGLLGLVIYITNQRTKEIGIRKVIGATVTQLDPAALPRLPQAHRPCDPYRPAHLLVGQPKMARELRL